MRVRRSIRMCPRCETRAAFVPAGLDEDLVALPICICVDCRVFTGITSWLKAPPFSMLMRFLPEEFLLWLAFWTVLSRREIGARRGLTLERVLAIEEERRAAIDSLVRLSWDESGFGEQGADGYMRKLTPTAERARLDMEFKLMELVRAMEEP